MQHVVDEGVAEVPRPERRLRVTAGDRSAGGQAHLGEQPVVPDAVLVHHVTREPETRVEAVTFEPVTSAIQSRMGSGRAGKRLCTCSPLVIAPGPPSSLPPSPCSPSAPCTIWVRVLAGVVEHRSHATGARHSASVCRLPRC
jgi:hypothetical protein